jgi:lysophospholipase L1-like esterase
MLPKGEIRLCFIGDSFVNGTGDPQCLGWTGRLCQAASQQGIDITYYNLGVRRETSKDIKSRWLNEVLCRLPDGIEGRLIFSFGANDMTIENRILRVNLAESLQNTEDILTQAKQYFPVLMIGPAPIADDPSHNLRIANLSQQYNQLCHAINIPYLDVFTPLSNSKVWQKEAEENDGAHPKIEGYTEYAKLVIAWQPWQNWLQKN